MPKCDDISYIQLFLHTYFQQDQINTPFKTLMEFFTTLTKTSLEVVHDIVFKFHAPKAFQKYIWEKQNTETFTISDESDIQKQFDLLENNIEDIASLLKEIPIDTTENAITLLDEPIYLHGRED